jgi:hypothetical protein
VRSSPGRRPRLVRTREVQAGLFAIDAVAFTVGEARRLRLIPRKWGYRRLTSDCGPPLPNDRIVGKAPEKDRVGTCAARQRRNWGRILPQDRFGPPV